MIKDYGLVNVSEQQKKVALRQWSTASQFLVEVLEKIVMVAHDEGQLSSEAVELYCTSCTANFASYMAFLSRVSILLLTRDIDIVILSVRLSVCP